MPQGLQIWNAAGQLTLDLNDRITKILGIITVNAAGSLSDAGFALGTPFCIVLNVNVALSPNRIATVTFSGTTMTWNNSGSGATAQLIYGIY